MAAESSDRSGVSGLSTDDRPSREEVARRINSLYDAAETATGNYNATRAMAAGGRGRQRPAAAGRPSNPPLDAVARQWFDAARAQLGPSVPAVLPAARNPARTAASRAGIPAPRRSGDDGGRDRAAGSRPVAELTAGPVGAAASGDVPELTAGPAIAALPPASPAPRTAEQALPTATTQLPQALQVPQPPQLPELAQESGRQALPAAAGPQQAWTEYAPDRELLSQYAAQPWAAAPELNSAPAATTWGAVPEQPWQPAPDFGTQSTPTLASQSMPVVGLQPDPGFGSQPTPDPNSPFMPAYGTQQAPDFGTQSMPVLGGTQPAPDFGTSGTPNLGYASVTPDFGTHSMPVLGGTQPAPDFGTSGTPNLGYASVTPDFGTQSMPGVGMQAAPDFGTQSMPGFATQVAPEAAWQSAQQLDWQPAPEVLWQPAPQVPQYQQLTDAEVELAFLADPLTSPSIPAVATATATPTAPAIATAPVDTAPVTGAPAVSAASKNATALGFARAQIGKPCLWGASGPDTYDCAALVQAAWRAAGVLLPRTAPEQALVGTPVPLTDVRPGDLVFFHGDAGHVGLYTGNSQMIHAPGPGMPVREESIFFAGPSAIQSAVRPA
ncbi:NlpC/P60 family protein [Streptomyces sp. NPDC005423]|uniref:C40 family peptidase n=1 Tax=Streptomyces sp. NPDC005423 TaxID=3155343 RepID=UPI0033AE416A